MTDEHPDLVRLREQEAAAIAKGYTDGDVNHYVQPIIGVIRWRLEEGIPWSDADLRRAADDLQKACDAETAWLAQRKRGNFADGWSWEHCSPKLLREGVNCALTPRRECICERRGSHDHLVQRWPA